MVVIGYVVAVSMSGPGDIHHRIMAVAMIIDLGHGLWVDLRQVVRNPGHTLQQNACRQHDGKQHLQHVGESVHDRVLD